MKEAGGRGEWQKMFPKRHFKSPLQWNQRPYSIHKALYDLAPYYQAPDIA